LCTTLNRADLTKPFSRRRRYVGVANLEVFQAPTGVAA
jgi:hypothetical protein